MLFNPEVRFSLAQGLARFSGTDARIVFSKDLRRRPPLQNQLLKPFPIQQAVIWLAAVSLLVAVTFKLFFQVHSPYNQEVLSLQGDVTLGHAIFQMNCSGCHGLAAQGRVGPNLHEVSKRKSAQGLIEQVTSGNTPPMPQFHPSAQEMADLLSYLKTL
jgi:mono/diheme cytochrome c family protein